MAVCRLLGRWRHLWIPGLKPASMMERIKLALFQAFSLGEKGVRKGTPVEPLVGEICQSLYFSGYSSSSRLDQSRSSSLVSTGNLYRSSAQV